MKSSSRAKIAAIGAMAIAGAALAGCGATSQSKNTPGNEATQTYAAMTMPLQRSAREAASRQPARSLTILVKSDEEHARKGPEGEWHDAFLPASFTVAPGQQVNVTVYNYDEGEHSFTSPKLGLNVKLLGGSASSPHKTIFSFVAPEHQGSYEWFCIYPCDPWAMMHVGFMRGYVTVAS